MILCESLPSFFRLSLMLFGGQQGVGDRKKPEDAVSDPVPKPATVESERTHRGWKTISANSDSLID